jgi:hypothetical protein
VFQWNHRCCHCGAAASYNWCEVWSGRKLRKILQDNKQEAAA